MKQVYKTQKVTNKLWHKDILATALIALIGFGTIACDEIPNDPSIPVITFNNATLTAGTVGEMYNTNVTASIFPAGAMITYKLESTPTPPIGLMVSDIGAVSWADPAQGTHSFAVTASAQRAEFVTATFTTDSVV
jgi:hypothetical protein